MPSDWMHELMVQHRSFRVVDLLPSHSVTISGRTFEDCTIYGPAVLVPVDGNAFDDNVFEADPQATFWEIPEDRTSVAGGILMVDCTFRRCVFRRIGIAGDRDLIGMFLEGATQDPDAVVGT